MVEVVKPAEEKFVLSLVEKIFKKFGEKSLIEKEDNLYRSVLKLVERPLIEYALDKTRGNQLKAAKVLGINRNTLRTKIKKLGIEVGKWKV